MRCRIAPGEMVSCWVLRVLLYGDGGGGVVFRRQSVRIVVEGLEGEGVVAYPVVEPKEGVEAVPPSACLHSWRVAWFAESSRRTHW